MSWVKVVCYKTHRKVLQTQLSLAKWWLISYRQFIMRRGRRKREKKRDIKVSQLSMIHRDRSLFSSGKLSNVIMHISRKQQSTNTCVLQQLYKSLKEVSNWDLNLLFICQGAYNKTFLFYVNMNG